MNSCHFLQPQKQTDRTCLISHCWDLSQLGKVFNSYKQLQNNHQCIYFLRHQSIPTTFFILNKDSDSNDSRFQVPQNQRYRTQSGAGRPYAYISYIESKPTAIFKVKFTYNYGFMNDTIQVLICT